MDLIPARNEISRPSAQLSRRSSNMGKLLHRGMKDPGMN